MKDRSFVDEVKAIVTTARAIFDAREFNEHCQKPPKFDLCDVTVLLDILAGFGTKKISFYSSDLCNMYYQLKIGTHIARRMAIMMDKKTYIPTVLPMGWSWACWIAQAICWGAILFERPGDEHLGIPPHVNNMKAPPGSIKMDDGTVIIVIIDTILVIGEPTVVKKWQTRIERNMADTQLALKYSYMTEKVDFAGLTLESNVNGTTWMIQEAISQRWKAWADEERTRLAQSTSKPTPLTLWKVAGFLRFIAPVVGFRACTLGRVAGAQSRCAKERTLMRRRDYAKIVP